MFFHPPNFSKTGGEKKIQKSGAAGKKKSQHTQFLCFGDMDSDIKTHTILILLVSKISLGSRYFSKK